MSLNTISCLLSNVHTSEIPRKGEHLNKVKGQKLEERESKEKKERQNLKKSGGTKVRREREKEKKEREADGVRRIVSRNGGLYI